MLIKTCQTIHAHKLTVYFSPQGTLALGASVMNLLDFSASQMHESPFFFMIPKITLQNALHSRFSKLLKLLQGKGPTILTVLTLLLQKENSCFKQDFPLVLITCYCTCGHIKKAVEREENQPGRHQEQNKKMMFSIRQRNGTIQHS